MRAMANTRFTLLSVILCLFIVSESPTCQAFCPAGCDCDDIYLRVTCVNASLDVIPFMLNPGLKYLNLVCNKINYIGQSLEYYPDIEELNLGHNSVKDLDSIAFENQERLSNLQLNHNNINKLKNSDIMKLSNLIEFNISNNQITVIESEVFSGLETLVSLDLSHNKLSTLSEKTFRSLIALQILHLSHNNFRHLPSKAVRQLVTLKMLDLSENKFTDVSSSAFYGMTNLTSLNLDRNKIRLVSSDAFKQLTNLTSLSLADNRLTYIPGHSLSLLDSLRKLRLCGNMFRSIDQTSFPRLLSMTHLYVTRCPMLTTISSEAFLKTPALESLDLSYSNNLENLSSLAFYRLSKLKELNLIGCGISFLHPNQIPRDHLEVIKLSGNPLNCNCSLLWLKELALTSHQYLKVDSPKCATPPEYYGKLITETDLQDVSCGGYFRWPTILAIVSVIALGILVIAVFLATRTGCRHSTPNCKTLHDDSTDHRTLPPLTRMALPPPPPPPPCFSPPETFISSDLPSRPPAFLAVRHMGPAPSPTNQALLPADWMFPSPYDDENHWYTTIGSDGCEYLTRESPSLQISKCHLSHGRKDSFRQNSASLTGEIIDSDKFANTLTYI